MPNALTDLLRDPVWRAKQLAAWERCVQEEPYLARGAGPPAWLVREEWKEGKEEYRVAALRVGKRYGLHLSPSGVPIKRDVPGKMSPVVPVKSKNVPIVVGTMSPAEVDVVTLSGDTCKECGKRDVERGRTECGGCRKARQRAKKRGA